MQAYTHFLVALALHLYCFPRWPTYPALSIAFIHHPFLDILAIMTYHPSKPQNTPFWWSYHLGIWVWTLVILYQYSQYWPVLLSSVAIDIWDWGFVRPFTSWTPVHTHLHTFRAQLGLPDYSHYWWAALPELALGWLLWNSI